MSKDFISVSVLTGYLKNIIDSEELLHNVALAGEVSGIRCSGAHAYFTLKDANSQIECACFGYARTYLPKSGESVILNGSVDFYVKGGKMTFVARTIQPLGQGLLAMQLEQLKKKLTAEGYFDESHKKAIPQYCSKVCVLTAKTGAVIRDIISTCRKKNGLLDIDVFDVKVQGEGAALSVIDALKRVDSRGYDVIIIARGGGSMEDLSAFNDEKLVYAIFAANTPIISAVGHETDFTLCDFVADLRVPTPTAAAEKVAYDVPELLKKFCEYSDKFKNTLLNKVNNQSARLAACVKGLGGGINLKCVQSQNKVEMLLKSMIVGCEKKDNAARQRIQNLIIKIDANNPTKILGAGYFKLYDESGLQTGIEKMSVGERVTLYGSGGRAKACVEEIIKEERNEL